MYIIDFKKSTFKGRRFDTIQEIKENSLRDLKLIPKQALEDCFENSKKSWERCISSGGITLKVTGAINAYIKHMFYDENFLNTPNVLGVTTCTIYWPYSPNICDPIRPYISPNCFCSFFSPPIEKTRNERNELDNVGRVKLLFTQERSVGLTAHVAFDLNLQFTWSRL